MNFIPLGAHDDGRVISSAVDLTVLAPSGANLLLISTRTQNVRFTLDGSAPTATKGHTLFASDPPLLVPLMPGMTLTVIEEAATADLQLQFGRAGGLP